MGFDPLSAFFAIPRNNLFASFVNLKANYRAIREIDDVFLVFLDDNWTDPENVAAAPFAFRAHSAYRAAAQLVLAGQVPEAYMVMRGCLENALYANHIDLSSGAWDAWRNRGESEAARKECVREFSGRNLFGSLRSRNARLGDIAGLMYERTIDLGAHPNEEAVTNSLLVEEKDTHTAFAFSYVAADGPVLRLAMRSLCQTGLMVLDTLCEVFPKHAGERGVETRLAHLKTGF
jgi:hypothetical protein